MQDDRTPFHIDTPFGPLVFERLANIYRQAGGRATSPRDFGALLLLWKGIAQYVACHPRVVRSDARIRWLH